MRNLLLVRNVYMATCCSQVPSAPTPVSWAYGAGNGDGVADPGPAPVYQRASGLGNGDPVTGGQTVNEQYSYGADGMSGSMVQFAPQAQTKTASPATPVGTQAAPGTHS